MPSEDVRFEVELYKEPDGTSPVKEDIAIQAVSNPVLASHVVAALDKKADPRFRGRHSTALGHDVFEWRIVNSDDARLLFFYAGRRQVIVVHLFVKKRQKLPKREFDIALRRMALWRDRNKPQASSRGRVR